MIRTLAILCALITPALADDAIPTITIRPGPSPTLQTLTARGIKAMDAYDDISAARLLLKPMADHGDADAARRIAETYDVVWLNKAHVIGADGLADFDQAMIWYKRAADMGDQAPGNRYAEAVAK